MNSLIAHTCQRESTRWSIPTGGFRFNRANGKTVPVAGSLLVSTAWLGLYLISGSVVHAQGGAQDSDRGGKHPDAGAPCSASEPVARVAHSPDRFLAAVRTFADNALTLGADRYGPTPTPLFIDGIDVDTHEPVKWKSRNG